jgi:hypothetical protein
MLAKLFVMISRLEIWDVRALKWIRVLTLTERLVGRSHHGSCWLRAVSILCGGGGQGDDLKVCWMGDEEGWELRKME